MASRSHSISIDVNSHSTPIDSCSVSSTYSLAKAWTNDTKKSVFVSGTVYTSNDQRYTHIVLANSLLRALIIFTTVFGITFQRATSNYKLNDETAIWFHYSPNVAFLSFVWICDLLCCIMFCIDMYYLYRTTGATSRKEMILSRFKSTFTKFEFFSCLPLEIIGIGMSANVIFSLRITKIFKLFSLLADIHELLVASKWSIYQHPISRNIFLCIVTFCVATNIYGSIWYTIVVQEKSSPSIIQNLDTDNFEQPFLTAHYFIVVTLCAVGYGDITPTSLSQVALLLCVQITGFIILTIIIGSFVPLLFESMIEEFEFTHRRDLVLKYLGNNGADHEIYSKTMNYFSHLWQRGKGLDDNQIYNTYLPLHLKREVGASVVGHIFKQENFLQYAPSSFIRCLADELEFVFFLEHDIIIQANSIVTKLPVLLAGDVEEFTYDEDQRTHKKKRVMLRAITSGRIFAQFEFISNDPTNSFFESKTNGCEIVFVHKTHWNKLLQQYPTVAARIFEYTAARKGRVGVQSPAGSKKLQMFASTQQEQDGEKSIEGLYLPHSKFKERWNVATFLSLLIYFFLNTIMVAFNNGHELDVEELTLFSILWITDIFFMIDIYMNKKKFAILVGKQVISDPDQVSSMYMKRRMWIDIASIIPFELLVLISGPRYMVIGRINRYLRFYNLKSMFFQYLDFLHVTGSKRNIIETCSYIMFILHIFACIWYLVGHINQTVYNDNNNWIYVDPAISANSPTIERYIRSVYFALLTSFTIGYGGIVPMNFVEHLILIMLLLIGTASYFTMMALITVWAEQSTRISLNFEKKFEILKFSLSELSVDEEIMNDARSFMSQLWSSQYGYQDKQILSLLPSTIQTKIMKNMGLGVIESLSFFEKTNEPFLDDLLLLFDVKTYCAGEMMFRGNTISEFFIVYSGVCHLKVKLKQDVRFIPLQTELYNQQDDKFIARKKLSTRDSFGLEAITVYNEAQAIKLNHGIRKGSMIKEKRKSSYLSVYKSVNLGGISENKTDDNNKDIVDNNAVDELDQEELDQAHIAREQRRVSQHRLSYYTSYQFENEAIRNCPFEMFYIVADSSGFVTIISIDNWRFEQVLDKYPLERANLLGEKPNMESVVQSRRQSKHAPNQQQPRPSQQQQQMQQALAPLKQAEKECSSGDLVLPDMDDTNGENEKLKCSDSISLNDIKIEHDNDKDTLVSNAQDGSRDKYSNDDSSSRKNSSNRSSLPIQPKPYIRQKTENEFFVVDSHGLIRTVTGQIVNQNKHGTNKSNNFFKDVGLIHPASDFKVVWNIVSIIFLLYYTFSVPYRIAFVSTNNQENQSYGSSILILIIIDLLIDIFNMIDIYLRLKLFTFIDEGFVEHEKSSVTSKYIGYKIVLDCISSIPYDFIIASIIYGNTYAIGSNTIIFYDMVTTMTGSQFAIYYWLRLTRLIRWHNFKCHIDEIDHFIEDRRIRIKPTMLRITYQLIFVLIVCHWGANLFYFAGTVSLDNENYNNDNYNWLKSDASPIFYDTLNSKVSNTFENTKYLLSAYWSLVTMSSVGFGDIKPRTLDETYIGLIVMIFGVLAYATTTAFVASFAAHANPPAESFREKFQPIQKFLKNVNISSTLHSRITKYFDELWKSFKGESPELSLTYVSDSLQNRICESILVNRLKCLDILRQAPSDLIRTIARNMKHGLFVKDELIVLERSKNSKLYFLFSGAAKGTSGIRQDKMYVAGTTWSKQALVSYNWSEPGSIVATQNCHVYTISREEFYYIISARSEWRTFLQQSEFVHRAHSLVKGNMMKLKTVELVDKSLNVKYNSTSKRDKQHSILHIICFFTVTFNIWFIPLVAAFLHHMSYTAAIIAFMFFWITDISMWLEFGWDLAFVKPKAAYSPPSSQITVSKNIQMHFKFATFRTIANILSLLPIDFIIMIVALSNTSSSSNFEPDVQSQEMTPLSSSIITACLFRLIRFYQVSKCATFFGTFQRLVLSQYIDAARMLLLQMIITVYLTLHICACVWFFVGHSTVHNTDINDKSWIKASLSAFQLNDYTDDNDSIEWKQYLISLYFILTLVTTVGYGDITPQNASEIVTAILLIFIGNMIYAGVIGTISSWMASVHNRTLTHFNQVKELESFAELKKLTPELTKKLIEYHNRSLSLRSKEENLTFLPKRLQKETALEIFGPILQRIYYFKEFNHGLMRKLVMHLGLKSYLEGDVIYARGDVNDYLHIIVQGRVYMVKFRNTNNDQSSNTMKGLNEETSVDGSFETNVNNKIVNNNNNNNNNPRRSTAFNFVPTDIKNGSSNVSNDQWSPARRSTYSPGQSFGQYSFFMKQPCSSSAISTDNSTIVVSVHRDILAQLCQEHMESIIAATIMSAAFYDSKKPNLGRGFSTNPEKVEFFDNLRRTSKKVKENSNFVQYDEDVTVKDDNEFDDGLVLSKSDNDATISLVEKNSNDNLNDENNTNSNQLNTKKGQNAEFLHPFLSYLDSIFIQGVGQQFAIFDESIIKRAATFWKLDLNHITKYLHLLDNHNTDTIQSPQTDDDNNDNNDIQEKKSPARQKGKVPIEIQMELKVLQQKLSN